mmetsp:Transcript_22522/g.48779  ORF Transcript_22522/g.48779 Transcript_22522/m.48779 type:complete len:221 (-) Transcript_22522:1098-1760(-)
MHHGNCRTSLAKHVRQRRSRDGTTPHNNSMLATHINTIFFHQLHGTGRCDRGIGMLIANLLLPHEVNAVGILRQWHGVKHTCTIDTIGKGPHDLNSINTIANLVDLTQQTIGGGRRCIQVDFRNVKPISLPGIRLGEPAVGRVAVKLKPSFRMTIAGEIAHGDDCQGGLPAVRLLELDSGRMGLLQDVTAEFTPGQEVGRGLPQARLIEAERWVNIPLSF